MSTLAPLPCALSIGMQHLENFNCERPLDNESVPIDISQVLASVSLFVIAKLTRLSSNCRSLQGRSHTSQHACLCCACVCVCKCVLHVYLERQDIENLDDPREPHSIEMLFDHLGAIT